MINERTLFSMGVWPVVAEKWGPEFATQLPEYKITENEEPYVLGQVLYESAMLTRTEENLNYSADGLLKTFPKYFTPDEAADYARQPERIANRVYANRMGNGDEASGDGWRYRGAGFIQLTGRDNHSDYAWWLERLSAVPLPREDMDPLLTAIYFWQVNGLNRFANAGDVTGLTRAINGGYNGLDDRVALTELAKIAAVA